MTIDDRLEALTMNLGLLSHSCESLVKSHESLAKGHEAIAKRQAKTEAGLDNILRRAIAASVKESLQERRKRRELDAKTEAGFQELRSAQIVTERLFQAWLKRSGNGKH